jgi:hypothetical protein
MLPGPVVHAAHLKGIEMITRTFFGVFGTLSILASCIGCDQPTLRLTPTADVAVRPTVRDDATTRPTQNAIEVPPPAPSPVAAAPSSPSPAASPSSTGTPTARGKVDRVSLDPQTGELWSLQIRGAPGALGCTKNPNDMGYGPKNNRGLSAVALAALSDNLSVEAEFDPQTRCITTIYVTR